jgi:MarR family 2-MHQ and catechol resistance regulon transcriptional repressor
MAITNYESDMCNEEKVLMAVVRAAEIFKRVISAIFRNYDLSFPQYNILRVLDASENGQGRITRVSRIMLVPGANMTGIAKRLEKNGFIVRKSDPSDERVTILEITQKGRITLVNIEKDRDKCQEKILKGFSQKEKEELLSEVKKLIKNSLEMI